METYKYPQFPTHLSVVHAALYTAVDNSDLIKKRIINASTAQGTDGDKERDAVNFAFVDARLITSRTHLQTAIYQAILSESQGSLITKTVHSEILWALNPTHNITEAIRRYGVSDTSTALFVIHITGPQISAPDVQRKMDAVVHGRVVSFTDLNDLTDWTTIKKYHKLNNEVGLQNVKGDVVRERAVIDNIVISSVAMKSVMG